MVSPSLDPAARRADKLHENRTSAADPAIATGYAERVQMFYDGRDLSNGEAGLKVGQI